MLNREILCSKILPLKKTESHGYEIEGRCQRHLTLFLPFYKNDIFKGTTCFLYNLKK